MQVPGSKKRTLNTGLYSLGQKNPGSGHKSDGDFHEFQIETTGFNDARDDAIDEEFSDADQH